MLDFHRIVIQLKEALGYNLTEKERQETAKGVCASYADKGAEAFLLKEYGNFLQRNHYIMDNYQDIPSRLKQTKLKVKKNAAKRGRFFYKEKPLSDEENMLLDIWGFFDQSDVYQNPSKYSALFARIIPPQDIQDVATFAQSIKAEEAGGRVDLASFSGSYNLNELTEFFKIINSKVKPLNTDFCFQFFGDHKLSLGYSHSEKSWTFIDIGEPFLEPVSIKASSERELAEIFFRLYHEGEYVAFTTRIVTFEGMQKEVRRFAKSLLKNNAFQQLHTITPEKIQRETAKGERLSKLILYDNDAEALQSIVNCLQQDISLMTADLEIAVLIAASRNCIESMRVILDADIKPNIPLFDANIKDKAGDAAILVASQLGFIDIVKQLIEAKTAEGNPGVDANATLSTGETAALLAAKQGHFEVVEALANASLANGFYYVDLNKPNENGINPLLVAVQKGHADLVDLLVNAKTAEGNVRVDLNSADREGETAVLKAVKQNRVDVLKSLLQAKNPDGTQRVKVDKPNKSNLTPLCLAAFNGNIEMVKLLVNAGANIHHKYQKHTVIKIAQQKGHLEIASWLKKQTKEKSSKTPSNGRSPSP
ncbi:MAG: ankyrin repeat domain-containing protein [Tatlockia sp.]|jgi:ankyrin repeat protein